MSRSAAVEATPAVRLLTRLFLQRLIDNDLISPHADRHESLALLYAAVLSLALLVTFLVSTVYLAAFIQLPGPTALSALSDRFLFMSASMVISALAALMVWDALALETRDAAILGPLPIHARTIARAKFAATFLFAIVFTIAVNAVPIVVYPLFLTLNLRGISGSAILGLIAGQGTAAVMAGLFGFLTILALRGVLRLALGERSFGRVSSGVQGALVVSLVTALLLTPTVRAAGVRDWIAGVASPRWPAVPALWHLGLHETLVGHVVADTPVVMPPRMMFVASLKRDNDAGRTAYRALGPQLAALAKTAWQALALVGALAVATFLWNNRRLPERSAGGHTASSTRSIIRTAGERLTRANPEVQAGFFFTLQTLARSAPHRTIVAMSLAGGLTLPLLILTTSGIGRLGIPSTPLGFFALHLMVVSALIAGLRYAVTVPAELPSNWTIRMAWLGDERGYLAGVKGAGFVVFVTVPSLLLLPLHLMLFGFITALVHTLHGMLFAAAILDVVFLRYRKMPFACSYVPIENPKVLWPAAVASFLLAAYGFAYVERLALRTPAQTAMLGASLAALVLITTRIDGARRRERLPVNFDERPTPATLRLGLFERMAVHD
jgi:hypothetical protein